MTTNYGERPGIIEQGAQAGPRTMTAERERGIRGRSIASGTAEERSIARALLAELDAERAAHATTLAALRAYVAADAERAALAQARGEVRP